MGSKGRRDKPAWMTEVAAERIEILFREAEEVFSKSRKLANRYVFIARKLAMKFNLKIPSELKRRFCHKCYSYLMPGENAKVRTNAKTKCVEWTCECGEVNRYGYSRESGGA